MKIRLTLSCALLALTAGLAQARDDVTIGMVLEPPNLDPTSGAAAAVDEIAYGNIFQGLARIAADGSVQPALATSWEMQDDGRSYLFHLRTGVRFHDGSDFDASDVVFTLDRARADSSTNAQKELFQGIESVEAVDPLTVRVTLRAPDGGFAYNMAWGDAVILDPASADQAATAPIGTGPYRLAGWRQGDSIRLEAFADYWGDAPPIRTATFRFIADPTAAFAAIMAGDVDAFPNYPAVETLPQIESDPRFQVLIGTTEGETILAMNNARKPLDDLRVRKAISHAINRQDVIDGAMFGVGTPIGTHFSPTHADYIDLTGQSAYDPEQSRDLLQQAGVSDLTLRLALPPPPYARRGGEIIAAQLRAVGIQTTITNMEWAQWLETVFKGGDFDLTVVSHVEPMDIGIYAREDYYFHYARPEFQQIMAQLKATTDAGDRSELLHQAQRMVADDYVNVWLFQLPKVGVADARLSGLWQNAPMPATDLAGLSWQD